MMLIAAVRRTLSAMTLLRVTRPRGRPRSAGGLTPAETETLTHVRRGLSNKQIALERGVSVNTVRSHVASLLHKSGLARRKALAQWRDGMEGKPADVLRCSFCRKNSTAVEFLVAGPDVFICGGCIALCNGVIAKARAGR